jgi:hypothetical protein
MRGKLSDSRVKIKHVEVAFVTPDNKFALLKKKDNPVNLKINSMAQINHNR